MTDILKTDHEMREHDGHNVVGNGAELSRQVTVQLSPEQYERLFFQPSAPRRGDFAKRFGTFSLTCIVATSHEPGHSQPNATWSYWFPHPIHFDHSYSLRLSRCDCSSKPYWLEWRLLLLWMYCYESRWCCGVRSW